MFQCLDAQTCAATCYQHIAHLSELYTVSAGLKARGVRTDAHVSVNSVVERILAAEAEESAGPVDPLPSPETATSPHLPEPSKQKQGDLMHTYIIVINYSVFIY